MNFLFIIIYAILLTVDEISKYCSSGAVRLFTDAVFHKERTSVCCGLLTTEPFKGLLLYSSWYYHHTEMSSLEQTLCVWCLGSWCNPNCPTCHTKKCTRARQRAIKNNYISTRMNTRRFRGKIQN